MKRLLILLLVALLLPLIVRADSLMSVSDLRAQIEASGGRWTQTYTSVRGETISVDVMLDVPDVPAFPILKSTWTPKLPDQFVDDYGPNGADRPRPRWYVLNDRYSQVCVEHNWDFVIEKSEKIAGHPIEHPSAGLPHDGLNWSGAYAYNNDLPIGEAFAFMKGVVEECYTRYGFTFYEPYLNYVTLENPPSREGVYLREKGAYDFHCYEAMRGIPILTSIGQGCNLVSPVYELYIISQDSYGFISKPQREVELVIDDVPLLPFDKIKPAFEDLIQKGLLRDVFMVQLGYVAVYEEGKMENEVFRLIPCWKLTGEYYRSAKDEANHAEDGMGADDDPNYIARASTNDIIVNAQTGKIIDREASNKQNRALFNVKTW